MALFCDDVSAIVRCACAAMPWVSSCPCDCATTTDKPAEERASGAARMPATRIGNAARLCMHDSPIGTGCEPLPANARRRLLVHGRSLAAAFGLLRSFAEQICHRKFGPGCKTRHWRLTYGSFAAGELRRAE